MDERDSRNGTSLSEEAQCGGSVGRAPLLRALEVVLKKAPNTVTSFHRGPFPSEGKLECGRVLIYRRI